MALSDEPPLIEPQEIIDRANLIAEGATDEHTRELATLVAALALGFDALIKAIRLKDEVR